LACKTKFPNPHFCDPNSIQIAYSRQRTVKETPEMIFHSVSMVIPIESKAPNVRCKFGSDFQDWKEYQSHSKKYEPTSHPILTWIPSRRAIYSEHILDIESELSSMASRQGSILQFGINRQLRAIVIISN
jgi:hypothetical protein